MWLCLCCRDTQTVWHRSHLRSLSKPMHAFFRSMVAGLEEGSCLLSFGMERQTIRYTKYKYWNYVGGLGMQSQANKSNTIVWQTWRLYVTTTRLFPTPHPFSHTFCSCLYINTEMWQKFGVLGPGLGQQRPYLHLVLMYLKCLEIWSVDICSWFKVLLLQVLLKLLLIL